MASLATLACPPQLSPCQAAVPAEHRMPIVPPWRRSPQWVPLPLPPASASCPCAGWAAACRRLRRQGHQTGTSVASWLPPLWGACCQHGHQRDLIWAARPSSPCPLTACGPDDPLSIQRAREIQRPNLFAWPQLLQPFNPHCWITHLIFRLLPG